MDHESLDAEVARRSARVYLPLSLGAGALFYVAASLTVDSSPVARLGGAVWVSVLTLIVSMPLVITRVKKRRREGPLRSAATTADERPA